MQIVGIALGMFYGFIMLLTGGMLLVQNKLGFTTSLLMAVGGVFIIGTFLSFNFSFSMRLSLLILGLVLVHISAIINGLKLHGKPLIKHHLVRGAISLFLVAINILIYRI